MKKNFRKSLNSGYLKLLKFQIFFSPGPFLAGTAMHSNCYMSTDFPQMIYHMLSSLN
jgi:hypothetical protein